MQHILQFKAAVLIQCWYRKAVAKLEVRRRCAWNVLQAFEYARDEVELNRVTEFFVEFSRETSSQLVSSVACSATPNWMDSSDEIMFPLREPQFENLLHLFSSTKKRIPSELFERIITEATGVLQYEPNITELQLEEDSFVNICGDVHGNLQAVLQFFKQNGLPSKRNRIIFNGDFVDRGYKSVEVLSILFAAYLAFPGCVFLNRGNHEDIRINELYGFKRELSWKFPNEEQHLLELCSKAFCQLPVACLVGKTIFVCHGGIAPTTDLDKIRTLNRSKFVSVFNPCLDDPESVDLHEWQQLLNLLWSDPQDRVGASPNTFRGGGCYFGPDITNTFLQTNQLQLLIRSHQCIPDGWKLHHADKVLTIFSSYDYFGQNTNEGAYVRLSLSATKPTVIGDSLSELNTNEIQSIPILTVKTDCSTSGGEILVEIILLKRSKELKLPSKRLADARFTTNAAFIKLWSHVLQFEQDILKACHDLDKKSTGIITITDWCQIMREQTQLQIPWRFLRSFLVNTSSTNKSRVLYETMFTGLYVIHPKLKNNPELAKRLFFYQAAMEALFQLLTTEELESIDLSSISSTLKSVGNSPKLSEIKQLINELIDLLSADEARHFNLPKFFSEYQFVEVTRRM